MISGRTSAMEDSVGKWPPAGQNAGWIEVDDLTYPLVNESRCKTCRSPNRLEIETAIIKGSGYAAVSDIYEGEGVSARGIKRHFRRGHLPLLEHAVYKIQKEEAENRGQIVDEAATSLAALLKVAQLTVGKVHEDIVSGAVQPTLRDGVRFSKLLLMADLRKADTDWMIVDRGLATCLALARELMEKDSYDQFVEQVKEHPYTRPLLDRRTDGFD